MSKGIRTAACLLYQAWPVITVACVCAYVMAVASYGFFVGSVVFALAGAALGVLGYWLSDLWGVDWASVSRQVAWEKRERLTRQREVAARELFGEVFDEALAMACGQAMPLVWRLVSFSSGLVKVRVLLDGLTVEAVNTDVLASRLGARWAPVAGCRVIEDKDAKGVVLISIARPGGGQVPRRVVL